MSRYARHKPRDRRAKVDEQERKRNARYRDLSRSATREPAVERSASSGLQVILATSRPGGRQMIEGEPTLEEVLAEPIVLLAARSAGLSLGDLRALCEQIRARLMAFVRAAPLP